MTTKKKIFYGWLLLTALVVVGALGPMTRYGITAFFPVLSEEFGWSRSLIGTAQSISLWVYSLFSILAGIMVDRIGGKKTIILGGSIALIGWILLSSMNSIWQLFLYYGLVMGVAISFTHMVVIQSISRKWFIKHGGLAGGIVGSAFAIGTAAFSPLLTSMASDFGWRTVSVVTAIISGVVIVALGYFVIKDTPESVGLHPDGADPDTEEINVSVKDKSWSLRNALKTRQFWFLFTAHSLTGIVFNGIVGHLVIWGVDVGSSAASAGIFVTLFSGPSIIARIFGGIMGDRFGKKKILLIGTALPFIVVIFGTFGISTPAVLGIFIVILGMAAGFSNTLYAPYLGDLFGRKHVGSLFGILTLGWGLIGGTGPLLWGWIYDQTGSYTNALILSAAFYILALFITMLIRPFSTEKKMHVVFDTPHEALNAQSPSK